MGWLELQTALSEPHATLYSFARAVVHSCNALLYRCRANPAPRVLSWGCWARRRPFAPYANRYTPDQTLPGLTMGLLG